MKSKLKKGDRVTIYSDPITQVKIEGKAILHNCQKNICEDYGDFVLEYWDIKFENEEDIYSRFIRVNK